MYQRLSHFKVFSIELRVEKSKLSYTAEVTAESIRMHKDLHKTANGETAHTQECSLPGTPTAPVPRVVPNQTHSSRPELTGSEGWWTHTGIRLPEPSV